MYGNATKKQSDTVKRIIEGATQVFAASGFAGASVDEIAKNAGVNKASIYYHIGDKESLYGLVLHEIIQATLASINARLSLDQTPEQKLEAYIMGIAEAVNEHPPLPAVMMRAVSSGGQVLPEIVVGDLVAIYGRLVTIINEGIKAGVFEKTNVLVVYLMILASLAIHKNVEEAWSESEVFSSMFQKLDGSLFDMVGINLEGGVAADVVKIALKAVKK